jgi:hypothetical protein
MIHLALSLIYLEIVHSGDCTKKLNPALETDGDEAKQDNDGLESKSIVLICLGIPNKIL